MRHTIIGLSVVLVLIGSFFWPQIVGQSQVVKVVPAQDKNGTVIISINSKDKLTDELVAKNVERRKVEVLKQQQSIRDLTRKSKESSGKEVVYRTVYKKKIVYVPVRVTDDIVDADYFNCPPCVPDTVWVPRPEKKTWLQRIFH